MASEIWDLYDGNGQKTGRTMVRGEDVPAGLYHLGVHIWPMNSRGEFLVQKRSMTVQWKPGIWAVTGGSAMAGEDALTAARRELREENTMLSLRATTDAMTGLLNREATQAIIETALSSGQAGALLLLLDMDNLKDINDTHGHPIGDRAILVLTEQLRAIFPHADAVWRIGGDEFMIFLRGVGSEAQARAQLETLRQRLVQASQNKRATLRCSVGGAFVRLGEDYASLYRRADEALYYVKRNGRDGYAFYKDMH